MAESSSPDITPKEEPVTLDRPESLNPFLPAIQVEFTFEEIAFTTNNEVALLYPSHPNQEYFKGVSDFIFKCCLKEAFTRAPNQYKEYLSELWYTAKVLPDSKIWVSTPTGEVRGEIGYNREIEEKGTLKNSFLPLGSNLSVLVDKTKSVGDGLITTHTTSSANKESRADDISRNSHKKELEQAKATAKAEVVSLKAKPSYPNINQLTNLLVTELKNIQWELPAESFDLPHLASLVQKKLKTLDSLPGLLKTVTNTLNRFATLENASKATTIDVPSAGKATASPAEGEKNTKDVDTNLKNELVNLLGIDVITQYYNKKVLYERYYEKMKKRRQSSKIINCDVLTKKGHISLKVYKEVRQLKSLKNSKLVTYSWLNGER
nr:hypothetical protein [Tanacetum cinerariifolium]